MSTTTLPQEHAYELLHAEYVEAFTSGAHDRVSTPGCEHDETAASELLLSMLQSQHKLGDSTVLRMVLDVVAWADQNGSPEAELLIEELSATLAAWQIQLLRERGAL